MDAKQKYTEEEFEIDEYFLEQMRNYRNGAAVKVASVIDHMYGAKTTYGYIENKTGVVNDDKNNPVFFKIDYFRDEDGPIVLMDTYEISSDEYLDSINLNQNIT